MLDAGAAYVLRESGRSLLAVGVATFIGEFRRGEMVVCVGEDGREFARGLVATVPVRGAKIMGRPSARSRRSSVYVDEEVDPP